MPIAWHEECHANQYSHLQAKRKELESHMAEVDRLARDVTMYGQKIAEAKRRGLEGFDTERFMNARK